MKRLLLLLLLTAIPVFGTTTQITGTLVDATGNGINGTACFSLPVNAIDTSLNRALSPLPVCFPVTNGTFPTFANVTPNDVIQPANTYYQAQVIDRSGALVFRANYVIPTGAGTFNIGLAIPTLVTTSNIGYISPAGTGIANTFCCTQTFQGAPPFIITSTISVANLRSGVNSILNQCSGANCTGSPISFTNNIISFGGPLAMAAGSLIVSVSYTNSGSYQCFGWDTTNSANKVTFSNTSGISTTATGTGTDNIVWVCFGS